MFRLSCLLLLVLWNALDLVYTLNELEYDAQVAPPVMAVDKPRMNLWRNFVGQVREVFHYWKPQPKISPPSVQLRHTTPAPESHLEYYGALNPIYQNGHF